MPGISIHVVDVSRGVVASGMRVQVRTAGASPGLVADAVVSRTGSVDAPTLAAPFEPGFYEVLLHVAAYYARAGFALPGVPFLDVAAYRFGIDDPAQHYHLPFKLTPWGYSCFRGGA
jgi:5-hydroxyisourate hydrolase